MRMTIGAAHRRALCGADGDQLCGGAPQDDAEALADASLVPLLHGIVLMLPILLGRPAASRMTRTSPAASG